jgi:DNA-binding PadR family transcriptional regulator
MTFPVDTVLTDLVLDALTAGPRTGFEIARALESDFGASLQGREGALYAELIRLERDGFVCGVFEERGDGDRRRVYRLPVLVDLTALTAPSPAAPVATKPEPDTPESPE